MERLAAAAAAAAALRRAKQMDESILLIEERSVPYPKTDLEETKKCYLVRCTRKYLMNNPTARASDEKSAKQE